MKSFLKNIIIRLIYTLGKTIIGRFVENVLIEEAMKKITTVNHRGCSLYFTTPNPLTRWRAETYSTKEPETLEWIDQMAEGQILWDVGANVGLYAIYAAKHRKLNVFGFEPSVFNLELLGRNCALNCVSSNLTIIPLALSDKTGTNYMKHIEPTWGGALSSFGADFGDDGKRFTSSIEYAILGLSADDIIAKKLLPQPDHIKIDVDGIEHLILSGAKKTLRSVQSVLVEVNDEFTEQAVAISGVLEAAGLKLVTKQMSIFTKSGGDKSIYNQIWYRGTL